jgi:hypothetical protein
MGQALGVRIVLRVDQSGAAHTLAFEMPQDLPWVHQQQMLLQYSADETFQIGPEEKRNPRHKSGKKQPEAAPIGRPSSFQQEMARLNRRLDFGRTQEIFDRFRTPRLQEKRFQSRSGI